MDTTKDYMDPDKVKKIAQTMETFANVLKVVIAILEVQITLMKTTAFIGNVGGLAIAQFLKSFKPRLEKMEKGFRELSAKTDNSVKLWLEANK